MQVQYSKLLEFSEELTSNPMVGGRSSITVETRDLRGDWERLKDNVMDSLTLLQREYDDWVREPGKFLCSWVYIFAGQAKILVRESGKFVWLGVYF